MQYSPSYVHRHLPGAAMPETAAMLVSSRLVLAICDTVVVMPFPCGSMSLSPSAATASISISGAQAFENDDLDTNTRARIARRWLRTWLHRLRRLSQRIRTQRIGFREFPDCAQICVYDGVICVDTSAPRPFGRPRVFFKRRPR